MLGDELGGMDGESEADADGARDGTLEGKRDAVSDGCLEGRDDGALEAATDGNEDGGDDGTLAVGMRDGTIVGAALAASAVFRTQTR